MTKPPLSKENAYNLDVTNRHKNIVVLLDGTILTDSKSLQDFLWGVGGTSYYGLYGEAPAKGFTIFRLQVYERVGISGGRSRGRARGAQAPPPPPIFGPNWARSAEKNFGKTAPLPCLFQGLDLGLISLVEVYKKVRKTVISVWKKPKRANRCISWLTVKKSRKPFFVWFIYVWETVHLQKLKRMQRSKLGM